MPDPYEFSLDIVLQMLFVFEGVSFWRLSRFAIKKNQTSRKSLKAEFQMIGEEASSYEEIPWGKTCLLLIVIYTWPIRTLLDWGVRFFKYTPLVSGIAVPVCVVGHFVGWISLDLYEPHCKRLALVIIWFILIKLFVNLLAPALNWFRFRLLSVAVPDKISIKKKNK